MIRSINSLIECDIGVAMRLAIVFIIVFASLIAFVQLRRTSPDKSLAHHSDEIAEAEKKDLGLKTGAQRDRGAAPSVSKTTSQSRDIELSKVAIIQTNDAAPEIHAAQRQSVVEAVKAGTFPERLSPLVKPKPFDLTRFNADTAAYLATCEPGRAFQSAEGAPGRKALQPAEARNYLINPGKSVKLAVKAEPLAPVTFTTFDKGAFRNELPSETVLADKDGIASVLFIATAGTVDEVHILAGSPLSVGTVAFVVQVKSE
jgi:hypothetical protein